MLEHSSLNSSRVAVYKVALSWPDAFAVRNGNFGMCCMSLVVTFVLHIFRSLGKIHPSCGPGIKKMVRPKRERIQHFWACCFTCIHCQIYAKDNKNKSELHVSQIKKKIMDCKKHSVLCSFSVKRSLWTLETCHTQNSESE